MYFSTIWTTANVDLQKKRSLFQHNFEHCVHCSSIPDNKCVASPIRKFLRTLLSRGYGYALHKLQASCD